MVEPITSPVNFNMQPLTAMELNRLNELLIRFKTRNLNPIKRAEMDEFLDLINRASPQSSQTLTYYLHQAGYSSIEQFKLERDQKFNEELIGAIIGIGAAILVGYGLSQLMKNK